MKFTTLKTDQTTEKFELDKWPFYWIAKANGHYLKSIEKALKGIGLDNPRWRVLMLLKGEQARSVTYLATESVTKLSTMTRIVIRMKEEGLIKVRQRDNDARVTEAYLTEKGKTARVMAWKHANAVIEVAFKGIDKKSTLALMRTLSKITSNLDQSK